MKTKKNHSPFVYFQVGEFSKRGLSSFTNTGYNDIEKTDNVQSNQDWNWVDDVKNSSQTS